MIEVDWTNSFYKSKANLFTPAGRVNESKTSWVKEAEVDYTSPAPITDPTKPPIPGENGNDPKNPLGLAPGLGTPNPSLGAPEKNNNTLWIIVGGAVLVVAALLIYFRQPAKPRTR